MKTLKLRRVIAFVMALVMLMPFVCVPVSAETLPTFTVESTSVTDGYVNMTVDLHDYINTDMYIRLENTNGSTTFYFPTPWFDENGRFVSYVTTSPVTLRVPLPDYGIYRVNPEGHKSSNGQSWQCAPIQISYLSPLVSVATSAGIRQLEPNVNNTYYEVVGDAPTDDGVYILNKNGDYKYAVYCNAPSSEAQQAVYISSGGSVLKTETLTWNVSKKIWGGAAYAAADFPDAAKIEFQAVRDPSKKISIDISRVTIGSVGSVSFTTNAYDYSYQCLASYISRRYSGAVQLNELATVVSKSGESYNAYAQGNSGVFTTSCGNFSEVGSEVVDMTAGGWRNAAGTGEDDIWTTPALYHYAPSGTTVNISIDAAGASKTVAALIYKSKDGKEVTVEHEYSGSAAITVPSDAMQLLYVEARVYNERGEVSATQKTKLENYYCSNFVEFTNVPDSVCNFTSYKNMDGYFRGFEKRPSQGGFVLTVTDSAGKTYRTYLANTKRYKFDPDWHLLGSTRKTTSGWDIYPYFSYGTSMLGSNVPSYEMGGTMPNLSVGKCTYELTSDGRHVTSGTFTVTGEFGQKVALNDIPEQYQSFQVNVSSASANGGKEIPAEVVMDITTPDGQTNRISSPASDSKPAFIPFLPVGSRIKAAVSYDADAYPFIKGVSPANGEYTLVYDNDRQQSLDFAFEAISKRSITGKLLTGTDKKAVPYANVIVSQTITRSDGTSYTHKTTVLSDENGNFTVPDAYAGYAGTVEIRANGYNVVERGLASGSSTAALGEISLDYFGTYSIIPTLKKEPIRLRGADGNNAKDIDGKEIGNELEGKLLDSDAALLEVDSIEVGGTKYYRTTDWFENIVGGQNVINFKNVSILSSAASSGKKVTVHYKQPTDGIFDIDGTKMTLRSFDVTAEFDSNNSIEAAAVAYKPEGDIRVTAVSSDSEYKVGYAVLSDGVVSYTDDNGNTQQDINVVSWAGGKGELSVNYSKSAYSSGNSFKLYTFNVNDEDSKVMTQMLKNGRPKLSVSSSAVKTTDVKLVENSIITAGEKIPSNTYSDIDMGAYSFDYVLAPYDEDVNLVEVRGILTKRDTSSKDTLSSVSIDSGAIVVNGIQGTDDGVWTNKTLESGNLKNIVSAPVYALVPYKSGTSNVDFTIKVSYQNNDTKAKSSDVYKISDEILNFDITVPDNISMTDEMKKTGWNENDPMQPWKLGISIAAYKSDDAKENVITVWDNGAAIGTVNANELDGATERKFALTDMYTPGTHTIYATREQKQGSGYVTVSTPKRYVFVSASKKDVFAGGYVWYHNGKVHSGIVAVNPHARSIIVFKVYGALSTDVDSVGLIIDGYKQRKALPLYDDTANNVSYWSVSDGLTNLKPYLVGNGAQLDSEKVLELAKTHGILTGASTDLEAWISCTLPGVSTTDRETLREQAFRSYYELRGLDVPDNDEKINAIEELTDEEIEEYLNEDNTDLPPSIAELKYTASVSNGGKTVTYTANATANIPQASLTVSLSDDTEYSLYELYHTMELERAGQTDDEGYEIHWAQTDSAQGYTLERIAIKTEKITVNGRTQYHTIMKKTVYLPSEVRDALYSASGLNSVTTQSANSLKAFSADEYSEQPVSLFAANSKTKAKVNAEKKDPCLNEDTTL